MKMIKKFTSVITASLFGILLVSGCKKEPLISSTEEVNSQKSLVAQSCELYCIDENSGDAYAVSTSNTVSWGGRNSNMFTKTGTVKVWNTATHIVYQFTSTVQISDLIVNGTSTGLSAAANTALTYSVALSSGWNACDAITNTFGLAGSGPQIIFTNVSYNLIGICTGCVNELSSNLVCGSPNIVSFTFTATESVPIVIQGGLTAGTSIVSASSNVLTLNPNHPSAGGPSNVTRWEGNVEACEEVTVTITFQGGNGIGAWSAKRGTEVLGSTPSQTCQ